MTSSQILGLPGWAGSRGMTFRGGTGGATDSVLHSYLAGGRRSAPVLVFAQSTVRDQTEAALRNLLGPADRPDQLELLLEEAELIEVEASSRSAVRRRWSDPRVSGVSFPWQGAQVAVVSWEYPLDGAFFRAVGAVGSGS